MMDTDRSDQTTNWAINTHCENKIVLLLWSLRYRAAMFNIYVDIYVQRFDIRVLRCKHTSNMIVVYVRYWGNIFDVFLHVQNYPLYIEPSINVHKMCCI